MTPQDLNVEKRYGKKKLVQYSSIFDPNEEEYIGAANSTASDRLLEAIDFARQYMKHNSLYLRRNQLKAVGGGRVQTSTKSGKRVSLDVDQLAAVHQDIDLYAKPSDLSTSKIYYLFINLFNCECLDTEAEIIRQKAGQEYEIAFKAIRKVLSALLLFIE